MIKEKFIPYTGSIAGALLGISLGARLDDIMGTYPLFFIFLGLILLAVGYLGGKAIMKRKPEMMRIRTEDKRLVGISVAIYLFAMVAIIFTLDVVTNPVWRFVLAGSTLLPATFLAFSVGKAIFNLDDMQRNIQLQGVAIGFLGTIAFSFTYGVLGIVGVPQLSWSFVPLVMTIMWAFGKLYLMKKYS
ncbi:MAG: hypothetical protein JXA19_06565 [Anaerolineales bacterium]|nr:hypothetical protein [Anaerolineales bacterium]